MEDTTGSAVKKDTNVDEVSSSGDVQSKMDTGSVPAEDKVAQVPDSNEGKTKVADQNSADTKEAIAKDTNTKDDAVTSAQTNGTKEKESTALLTPEEKKNLEAKIAKQIEYYFGDMGLSKDKFLLEEITKDDGWIPLTTMLRFNRLSTMTQDKSLIVSALKNSTVELMEVNEDESKIRRLPSMKLPENTKERQKEINSRTIYAKRFPDDSTLDKLQAYFNETHGNTEHVFLRTWGPKDDKKFKGSVFVTFEKKEDADKFVKAESIKYGEEELVRLYRQAYYDQKHDERDGKKKGGKERKQSGDTDDKLEDQTEDEKAQSQMTKGAVLHLTGVTDNLKLTHIKTFFMDLTPVAWVDLSQNNKEAWVRFKSGVAQETLDTAKEANDGKLEIHEAVLEATVLDGTEELEYWKKLLKELEKMRQNKGGRGHGRRGGGRGGGRGGDRGGKRKGNWGNKHKKWEDDQDDDSNSKDDTPPAKAAKLDVASPEKKSSQSAETANSTSEKPAKPTSEEPAKPTVEKPAKSEESTEKAMVTE